MEDSPNKRGRKAGVRGLKVHAFYGPRQARLCVLLASTSYPNVFRPLGDAYRLALLQPDSFKYLLDCLVSGEVTQEARKEQDLIENWSEMAGLQGANWAIPLAAKIIWKATNSPAVKYVSSSAFAVELQALASLGRLHISDVQSLQDARLKAERLSPELRVSFIFKSGYKPSPFGDFTSGQVGTWLGRRLIEVRQARLEKRRLPGWDTLVQDIERPHWKTVRRHVRTMAAYVGVPSTEIE